MTARRARVRQHRHLQTLGPNQHEEAVQASPSEPPEPVRTPADRGWLSPVEAQDFLRETFGATVSPRTIQAWTRDPERPLRHARLGHRLLVHRDDLLARVTT